MPVVVFGGMAWTFTRVGHFRMTAVTDRLGPRLARFTSRVQLLIALGFFVLLARLQYQYAVASWLRREFIPGILSIPVYPTKAAIAVGCAVAAVSLAVWLLSGRELGDQDLGEVR
jgi:TRAP-type C4-dicarboxylate transport system permease small subunit